MSRDEEWTQIRRKSRRSAPATKADAVAHSLMDRFEPRTTGILQSPEALQADYDKIQIQWLASPTHESIAKLVDTHAQNLTIKRIVCLGIGTFDPEDGAWEAKRAAFVQLCALSTLASQLDKYSQNSIECIFQEPIFTQSDKTFLQTLGYTIVKSPAAYSLIDDSTLLFAVHLYRPIYAAALQASLPAIYIGTGWDVWDTVTIEKATDLENMKIMEDTYTKHFFPQDTASTAFSSTSIYFKPTDMAVVDVTGATHTKPLEAAQSTTADKPVESVGSPPDEPSVKLADSPVTSSITVEPLISRSSKDTPEPSQDSHREPFKDRKSNTVVSDTTGEAAPKNCN